MCTVNSVVESVQCILYILHCTLKYQTQCRFGLGGVTEAHSAANWAHILYSYTLHTRHLIVHSDKSQIGCIFRERAKLSVISEKEPNCLSIWRKSKIICQFGDELFF